MAATEVTVGTHQPRWRPLAPIEGRGVCSGPRVLPSWLLAVVKALSHPPAAHDSANQMVSCFRGREAST